MSSLASATGAPRKAVTYVRDLWARKEFAWHLALSELKARNATTSLGILWWVLNPLLMTGVYFLVFGIILSRGRRSDPEYLGYLMSGMFAFHFTTGVVTGAAGTILRNARLIVNLRFPRLLLPISSIIESGIGFLVSIVAFFAIIIPQTGNWPGWRLVWLLPIFVAHLAMNLGLAALVARLAVPFRDVSNLIPFLVRIWLYLSPIIWTLELLESADVPSWLPTLMNFNPMFHFLSVYRTALLGWDFDPGALLGAGIWAVVIVIIGTITFVRFEGRVVQYL